MATQGFEFYGMLDGSNATPVIRDFILGVAAAHYIGDLVLMQADGYVDQVTTATTEVTGVIQENVAAADIVAGTTKAKVAIITRNQIWRVSADASTMSGVVGYTKANDTLNCRKLDADNVDHGAVCILDKSDLDDDGNVKAQIVFLDTTFGNT